MLFPSALNAYAGAKFKLVRGYSGTIDIVLAMERGEVDIVGAYGLPGIMVSQPGWVTRGEATFLYQAALKRHRLIPNVPTLPELATSDEGKLVLHAAASTGEFGRSILTTPGVPAERLAALRTAFAAMLTDPNFLAAATRSVMERNGLARSTTMMKSKFESVETVRKSVLGLNGSDLNTSGAVAFCPLTRSSVCPSGCERAAVAAAVIPPAPGMFSMTNGWPIWAESFCATERVTISPGPPGPKPTRIFTGRDG